MGDRNTQTDGVAADAEIALGKLRGVTRDGVVRFLGVPFAGNCAGENRWLPPQPVDPWQGILVADRPGPSAPQRPTPYDWFGPVPDPQDENCLFLNIYTPAPDGARRPVLVWIHGGAFVHGSGSEPVYDGANLAKRGDVVVVTINYRLGVLGFLGLNHVFPELTGCANLGLLDQIAALKWVKDHIAAFGGDPDCVTIFGESAGGMSVVTLLAMRAADGLYHRAIIQSGGDYTIGTSEQSAAHAHAFLELTGCSTLEELRALPIEALLDVQDQIGARAYQPFDNSELPWRTIRAAFQPTAELPFLEKDGPTSIEARNTPIVPLLVGACADEWTLFAFLDPVVCDQELVEQRFGRMFDDAERAEILDFYRNERPGRSPGEIFARAFSDNTWIQPALHFAEAANQVGYPSFSYLLTWGPTDGSLHAFEVPFLFANFPDSDLISRFDAAPPQQLVDAMQESWLAFARTGDPSNNLLGAWPPFKAGDYQMAIFDEDSRIVGDPIARRRQVWKDRTSAARWRAGSA